MIDELLNFNKTLEEAGGNEKEIGNKDNDRKMSIGFCMESRLAEILIATL